MLSFNYIQKGLLFTPPTSPPLLSTADIVDHLAAALATALDAYYPVAGRFVTERHQQGCAVSIDCDGQGVQIVHAVADGIAIADVIPPDADVPRLVHSFFPLEDAVNYDGHHVPLFVVQVTELNDGVFVGFVNNHALSDGTAFWEFINAWAEIARAESLVALKERARQELLAAGDTVGAAALTRFQALSSLLWRCITRARGMAPEQVTACRASINNRGRLRPPLPVEYFGNSAYAIGTESVRASELLERGHGWAAAAVGRAVAAHTDASIRARVESWMAKPVVYSLRFCDASDVMMGSSPQFDMYGCDFGWGKAVAARSGKANKFDGKTSLFPGQEGGGSMDAELVLTPEHMAALEDDGEFWAAVTPCHPSAEKPPLLF
ncbi:hypothetical protein GUJ93_ZPchr0007g4732 [Zizania palustris]|uniref:Acetyltransferase n=1 Tax=Zizania palustris TaxID=103762 RepID=A0A8J5TES4_ZIZPA|nr:hypothetical protein GUJ93_ZPchr0007g4732 [Zizania palustris]